VNQHVHLYRELSQGSEEWAQVRCGMLTASEMKLIVTPTLKPANNDEERAHMFELLAQRISGYVEPAYQSDDMERGVAEEIEARRHYSRHFAPVRQCGFIVNTRYGFPIGYSPDGLVGEDGLLEAKSRRQKFQVRTVVENGYRDAGQTIPSEFRIQCQTGLLVSERAWLDFVSYSGGLPGIVIRVLPDRRLQMKILTAAIAFEKRLRAAHDQYHQALGGGLRSFPTERTLYGDVDASDLD